MRVYNFNGICITNINEVGNVYLCSLFWNPWGVINASTMWPFSDHPTIHRCVVLQLYIWLVVFTLWLVSYTYIYIYIYMNIYSESAMYHSDVRYVEEWQQYMMSERVIYCWDESIYTISKASFIYQIWHSNKQQLQHWYRQLHCNNFAAIHMVFYLIRLTYLKQPKL